MEGGGGGRRWREVVGGGGGWRWREEVERGSGGWRWRVEVEGGGEGWRWRKGWRERVEGRGGRRRCPDDLEALSCSVCPNTKVLDVSNLEKYHLLFKMKNVCMKHTLSVRGASPHHLSA